MTLLDDLQAEVRKIRAEEHRQNAELDAQELFYDEHMRSVMIRAYDYLSEIVENLQIIAPEIYASYPIGPPEKKTIALRQTDYKFNFDNAKSPRQLDILCQCVLDQPLEFHVPTKDEVVRHAATLESYRCIYHRKDVLDKLQEVRGATFLLEGPMKVHIRIVADPSDKRLFINLRNLEDLPFKSYKFSPESVDEALLERLARVLIRQEPTLVAVKVCDTVREDLQRKIEVDKRQKEQDLAKAYALLESEKLAENNAKLVNRAKRLATDGTERLLKVFSKT